MDTRRQTLDLLNQRKAGATVCPSEVARALAAASDTPLDWRAEMPRVHRTIDDMVARGEVALSWKGRGLARREGPYRIHRAAGAGPKPE